MKKLSLVIAILLVTTLSGCFEDNSPDGFVKNYYELLEQGQIDDAYALISNPEILEKFVEGKEELKRIAAKIDERKGLKKFETISVETVGEKTEVKYRLHYNNGDIVEKSTLLLEVATSDKKWRLFLKTEDYSPMETIKSYFDLIEEGKIDEAIDLYTEGGQRQFAKYARVKGSLEWLSQIIDVYGLNQIEEEDLSFENGIAQIKVNLGFNGGDRLSDFARLVRQDGRWRVYPDPVRFPEETVKEFYRFLDEDRLEEAWGVVTNQETLEKYRIGKNIFAQYSDIMDRKGIERVEILEGKEVDFSKISVKYRVIYGNGETAEDSIELRMTYGGDQQKWGLMLDAHDYAPASIMESYLKLLEKGDIEGATALYTEKSRQLYRDFLSDKDKMQSDIAQQGGIEGFEIFRETFYGEDTCTIDLQVNFNDDSIDIIKMTLIWTDDGWRLYLDPADFPQEKLKIYYQLIEQGQISEARGMFREKCNFHLPPKSTAFQLTPTSADLAEGQGIKRLEFNKVDIGGEIARVEASLLLNNGKLWELKQGLIWEGDEWVIAKTDDDFPANSVKYYYELLEENAVSLAFHMFSERSRELITEYHGGEVSLEKEAAAIRQRSGIKSFEVLSEYASGDSAEVKFKLTYNNGEIKEDSAELSKENGFWRFALSGSAK